MKFKKLTVMLSLAIICVTNAFAMKPESEKITELRKYMIKVARKVVSLKNKNPFVLWLKENGMADAKHIYSVWAYNCFDMTYCGGERLKKDEKEKFRAYVIKNLATKIKIPYAWGYCVEKEKYGNLYWLTRAHDGGMTSWTYKMLHDNGLVSSSTTIKEIREKFRGIEAREDFFGNCFIGAIIAANKCEELGLEWFIACAGDNEHWECFVFADGRMYMVNFIQSVYNLVYNASSEPEECIAVLNVLSENALLMLAGWFDIKKGMSKLVESGFVNYVDICNLLKQSKSTKILMDKSIPPKFVDKTPLIS